MASRTHNLVAIDLGASNGRIVVGRFSAANDRLDIRVAHRFEHGPVRVGERLRWDWGRIEREIAVGLSRAADVCGDERIDAVGCSSWAQDFGLLDAEGRLFYPPVCYRDERTAGMPAAFAEIIGPDDLVRRVGCGVTPVTALCQLRAMAVQEPDVLRRASRLLFMADLVNWRLCGHEGTDWTMATASQLRNLHTGRWDAELLERLQIPAHFLPPVADRPCVLGRIRADGPFDARLAGVLVIHAAGHDTAAAAACAAPLAAGTFLMSLGTWAMLGACTGGLTVPERPGERGWVILGVTGGQWAVFRAGTGLWLLQECRRMWETRGMSISYEALDEQAAAADIDARIQPGDPRFHAPADMLSEVAAACREAGARPPNTPGEYARVIFESLAAHYAEALRDLETAVGMKADGLRVLGGGSRSRFLCGRMADAMGVRVVAGPTEATAIGNLITQAESLGIIDREVIPRLLANSCPADFITTNTSAPGSGR